ncbi:dethiobiotin synthase [Paramaledivibacter caminithermalis]|uniref:ATP-dependent dethiobiotin synthetase BioD n=1 Tax=Paramaledivibacter caminithermalis (strain DSM 15212 / CIP 107654 / DViRD3) TaxID=1121301 RepID=A0A1M6LQE0_PARC5|nr:dethiobiotin synthase [Paramaledivibacter caminithermalis]SHJ73413.1 dethiobiotin synthase [Paramaledivibacter caminithermalis DSM 15212]
MNKGVFIVGTDTDVGKTIVTAGLVYVLRKSGINTCCFKAVLSGGIRENKKLIPGDVKLVKEVSKIHETYEVMNPYCLETPVSPHLAAKLENVQIDREKILNTYRRLSEKYEFLVAEGSGGIIVPIIDKSYFIYDLIKDLNLPVIIVARAGVGTINHTALTVKFAESVGLDIKGIIINRYTDEIHVKDNIDTIKEITNKEIIAVIDDLNNYKKNGYEELKAEFEKKIDVNKIIS